MTMKATSYERYNGGIAVKRKYGSSTVTRFMIDCVQSDGTATCVIFDGYGKTPGERKTYAMNEARKAGYK